MLSVPSVEVNVVESCNLQCRGCSHLSPVLPRNAVDPDELEHDLTVLAGSYHASLIRLLGGEPLLHPDLVAVVAAVRRSGVADAISVQTNGVRLGHVARALWTAVDVIRITTYPGTPLADDDRAGFEALAADTGTSLIVEDVDAFRLPYLEAPHVHARRVFDECQIIHEWSCHTVAGGVFYRCPQTYFLGKVLGVASAGEPIHAPDLEARLAALLSSTTPLPACDHCLGSSGVRLPHEQVARVEWRGRQSAASIGDGPVLVTP